VVPRPSGLPLWSFRDSVPAEAAVTVGDTLFIIFT